ncbi:OprD family outer membrane porin [Citrobacter enshiensis]|uniref:OprD family outer membrane porin n=1 Tax=Citrobacter enshiensis TaxID=2971264 RepID=A0ABT8PTQ7_9ENTR|nr:OprD family outer membrane porin [Citrobacter enshiensis]MDN8599151.1 OprD family outer membrane porin [Citrobacter enshiensis]WET41797.1 OprD family outer membrane porin [Citrobacter enshiensis]
MSKNNKLPLLSLISLALTTQFFISPAQAAGFWDDSHLTGGIYYSQRYRDKRDMTPGSENYGDYVEDLHHSTFNANLDFISGYAADFIGFDIAGFAAANLSTGNAAHPNEISLSSANQRWGEDWSGDKGGFNLYKAALKFKHDNYWMRSGYIQPSGQTLLATHWGFVPGAYQGSEIGSTWDFGKYGALSSSYLWTDKYKAPWYTEMYEFRGADNKTKIDYIHSLGFKYDFKNNLLLEASWAQAEGFKDQYFGKVSYSFPVAGNMLRTSYQFYGAKDKVGDGTQGAYGSINDEYSGLAWLQGVTFGYTVDTLDFRLEAQTVKAEGNQGFFLQRITPAYASSNGRLDIWWDAASDFNANGETSAFAAVTYDLKNYDLPGWAVGVGYIYGWNAKPCTTCTVDGELADQNQRIDESAWTLNIAHTVQTGRLKGALFNLHYISYDNHGSNPNYSGGYNNMFQDEIDIKFNVMAPFTIF